MLRTSTKGTRATIPANRSGRIAERHDASGRPVAGLGQIFGDRDEIREGVDLVLAAPGIVPTLALFDPAADVGDGVDEAAVDQREQIGNDIGLEEIAVGTVRRQKKWRRAVDRQALAVQNRDRYLFLGGRGEQPAHLVGSGIVPAWNLLLLA